MIEMQRMESRRKQFVLRADARRSSPLQLSMHESHEDHEPMGVSA